MLSWIALLACAPRPLDGEDTAGSASPTPAEVDPVLTACAATCSLHETGNTYYQWVAACTYDDPQGADTIDPWGDLEVSQDDAVIATTALICTPETAACSTSFSDEQVGLNCEAADTYTFTFTIRDEDGHEASLSVPGEKDG